MNNTETIEKGEKFLPIGTVVMLKGGSKRAMITGFCSIAQEDPNKMYDYSGCIYPEGYVSSNQVCLFDHEQIDKVYYKGLIDDEEVEFKNKLNSLLGQINVEDVLKQVASRNESSEPVAEQASSVETPVVDAPVASIEPQMPEVSIPPVMPDAQPSTPAVPSASTIPTPGATPGVAPENPFQS